MKFNLKLFVLVGVFVGLRDVWGMEENEDDDGFIVDGLKNTKEENEVKDAMKGMRVIKAVYRTEVGGDVGIIDSRFKGQLSSIVVGDGNKWVTVQDFKTSNTASGPKIVYRMRLNVKYIVYFIFKQEGVNSTKGMFRGCLSLISADFTHFNTENVINMSYMFSGCWALKELDLSKFDTQNVENMSHMFFYCSELTELDLSKFDTTKVTDMSNMFAECTSLKQVFLPSTCVEKKKRCICCGDEYVLWNNHEVGGLKPGITKFKFPGKINLMIHTEK